MAYKKFPGVYELLVKKKGINALVNLGIEYVETSMQGDVLVLKGKSYKILDRSGLPPTGRLVLKEL